MFNRKKIVLLSLFVSLISLGQNEKLQYNIHTISFYNVENLFDAIDDPLTRDDDRTPEGRDRWTEDIYQKKLQNTAQVIGQIGYQTTRNAPVIMGLCEVENRKVLDDLIQEPILKRFNYGIIHFESPDERGIDVALLYQKEYFIPTSFNKHTLFLRDEEGERDFTRDQLVVAGEIDKEELHFIVNHWPSRSGGQERSEPLRIKAAKLNQRIFDSILYVKPNSKVITMGDFNDNPTNKSIKSILKTVSSKEQAISTNSLYNPLEKAHKQGLGTSCYRDQWDVLDQMIFSPSWLPANDHSWFLKKVGIFNKSFLINPKGRYKGYPFRSFAGGKFTNGYSDHYPVYAYIVKLIE